MKKKSYLMYALFLIAVSVGAHAQTRTGINTKDPKNTLDVNGDVRIRQLTQRTSGIAPTANTVVVIDEDASTANPNAGVLYAATALDVMFSSGLYVKQSAVNNWPKIFVGPKASQLDFVGQTTVGAAPVWFTFSVLYFKGVGFIPLPAALSKSTTGTAVPVTTGAIDATAITVTGVSITSFRVAVAGQTITFSITATDMADITASGGTNVIGTFASKPMYQ